MDSKQAGGDEPDLFEARNAQNTPRGGSPRSSNDSEGEAVAVWGLDFVAGNRTVRTNSEATRSKRSATSAAGRLGARLGFSRTAATNETG